MTTDQGATPWRSHSNSLLRFAGVHLSAPGVLHRAMRTRALPILPVKPDQFPAHTIDDTDDYTQDDYAQIDPTLPVNTSAQLSEPLRPNVGFAGLTADQRGFFFQWSQNAAEPAPKAYRNIYLAQLETWLLDEEPAPARAEIGRLLDAESWQGDEQLARLALLSSILYQDEDLLHKVLHGSHLSPASLGVALGWWTFFERPLSPFLLHEVKRLWSLPGELEPVDADSLWARLQFNLDSLAATLDADPLSYALEQVYRTLAEQRSALDEQNPIQHTGSLQSVKIIDESPLAHRSSPITDPAARVPGPWMPWRSVHRQLRFKLPQPDLRPHLEPLLSDMLRQALSFSPPIAPQSADPTDRMQNHQPAQATATEHGNHVESEQRDWYLVLEFGESRSQYYDYVVMQAQKLPEYQMLMDETRHIVHRILFRKRKLRNFWRLWEYVQNWASTRVYVNGEELEKWKIWPYSQYLR